MVALPTIRRMGQAGGLMAAVLAFVMLCAFSPRVYGAERIIQFHAEATVLPDASVTVEETIRLWAEGVRIRRGIIRDFPMPRGAYFNGRESSFMLQQALLDGAPVPYSIEREGDFLAIRLGDAQHTLPVGEHTFTLRYSVTNHLHYGEKLDELYWNVTGNLWDFPIGSASFRVHLPNGATVLDYSAYTGPLGAKGQDFRLEKDVFRTTRALMPGEGFTVAVGFAKGVVTPPEQTLKEKVAVFVQANAFVVSLGLAGVAFGLFGLLLFLYRKSRGQGLVIPLYHPPQGLEPHALRYAASFRWDNAGFCATLLQLAVAGYIRIEEKGDDIVLHKVLPVPSAPAMAAPGNEVPEAPALGSGGPAPLSPAAVAVLESLFTQQEQVVVGQNSALLYQAKLQMLAKTPSPRYRRKAMAGVLLLLVPALGIGLFNALHVASVAAIGPQLLTIVGIFIGSSSLLYVYSASWRTLADGIAGFTLYLNTAEKHRLEALFPAAGPVPEQNTAQFERFLPYAFALGVAQTWADSFASTLGEAGYNPVWYTGGDVADRRQLTWRLQRSLGRIERSVTRESARRAAAFNSQFASRRGGSGLGGGGFSGGGRGGGGGRGW